MNTELLQAIARMVTPPAMPNIGAQLAELPLTQQEIGEPISKRPLKPIPRASRSGQLAEAYRRAGFQVLNEYTNPSPWSTGGHLHVQWPEQRNRQMEAARLKDIASQLGFEISVGGWGTGWPHRGRAHKERRALDIRLG